MFDSFLIRQDSLENVEQEGVVIGFRFGVRIADYRGCILSLHNGYYVEVDWPTECTGLGCSSQSWLHTATCLLTKSGFGTRRNRAAALVQGKHRPYVITTLC